MPTFYHVKLNVYAKALEFVVAVDRVAFALPRERWYLRDQLLRAATSILLNIAEGASGQTVPTRLSRYRTSLGSAAECSAVFDLLLKLGLFSEEDLPRTLLNEIGAMLHAMVYRK